MSINIAPAALVSAPTPALPEISLVSDIGSWDALVAAAPFAHLTQSFGYGEGKRAQGWQVQRALFHRQGRPLAFATVLERHAFGARWLARVNRGPVMLDARPDPDDLLAVHAALRRRWRGPLLIAPALERSDDNLLLLARAGFRLRHDRGWWSGRIDLRRGETGLWQSYAPGFRNRARRAEGAQAAVEIATDAEAYEWMIGRHLDNMRQKRFHGADERLLRALRAAAAGDVLVFRAVLRGQPVAGMSVVLFGAAAEYHVGWFGPEGRQINAGNLLMWAAQRELMRRGISWFDVGGMKPGDGYTRFKRTMRPAEYRLAGEWMSF